MSVEENKAIELRFFEEVVNKGNIAVIDELFATNFVDHSVFPGMTADREGAKQFFTMAHTVFPDFHSTLEDMFAEGDKVVQRFTARGTHQGEFMGIAPTGKQVTIPGIAIHRITGGKIVENWVSMDMLGMMQQLGVAPQQR
ncbi:MAG: ester cyclase [Dehalococcoidales bacterium]